MIAIESKNGKLNFIAGLFKTKEKAEKAFQKLSQKEDFKLVEHIHIQFPFYIIEMENKFKYYQYKEDIHNEIGKIKVIDKNDEDISYCTLYIIEKEYVAKNPDIDSMGVLDHIHIDNEELKIIDKLISNI